jgi:hypothetical protein
VAALAVALILLFGITMVAFFTNRSLIFEQKTASNHLRATKAFEMAEAGLEWTIARLNDPAIMSAGDYCTTVTTTFADRYLPFNSAVAGSVTGFSPVTDANPGCTFSDASGAASCSCPSSSGTGTANTPSYANTTDPRFMVTFANVAGQPYTVRITSYGCTNAGTACGAGSGTPDATAVVSVVIKMKPAVANAPGAGLLAGSSTVTGGNLNVINTDPSSNGVTIDTGTTVTIGSGTNVVTLPGTPPRNSVLDNDTSLSTLTNADTTGDTFFKTFFGETMTEFQNDSQVFTITSGSCGTNTRCSTCGTASSCGSAVSSAYNSGYRKFWSDTDVSWTTSNLPTIGTLGSSAVGGPLVFATNANVEMKSNMTAYGLFYTATASATDNWDYSGSGSAKVYGAFISRGDFVKGSGTLDLIYDSNLFGQGGTRGTMVRVPGTWRDTTSDYTTSN